MVKRIACDPYFDDGLKKWIFKQAHKNYWRVATWMDLDDLVQEGFLCYAICRARYEPKNEQHLMSLVKITFINQITDLANRRTRTPETPVSELASPGNELELLESLAGGEDGDSELQGLLARAPKEVRALLAALSSDEGAERMRRPYRIREDGSRETTNERWCRLIGVPTFDLEAMLRKALNPNREYDYAEELITRLFA